MKRLCIATVLAVVCCLGLRYAAVKHKSGAHILWPGRSGGSTGKAPYDPVQAARSAIAQLDVLAEEAAGRENYWVTPAQAPVQDPMPQQLHPTRRLLAAVQRLQSLTRWAGRTGKLR